MTFVIQGPRIQLRQGATYRARARVDYAKLFASEGKIAAMFEDLGFSDVHVWRSVDDVPPDWPADQRAGIDKYMGPFTAFIEGTWNKAPEALVRPEPIIAVWIHRNPLSTAGSRAGSHAWARDVIRSAWKQVFDATPSDNIAQAVQAVSLLESGYGQSWTGDGKGSNNWGAVQCPGDWRKQNRDCSEFATLSCPENCFKHQDHDAEGRCYVGCFRVYPDPESGAADFVRELCGTERRRPVLSVIDTGSATRIARVMRETGYFELAADAYADRIAARAQQIAKALGEPLYVRKTSVLLGVAILGVVAGGVALGYRHGYV